LLLGCFLHAFSAFESFCARVKGLPVVVARAEEAPTVMEHDRIAVRTSTEILTPAGGR
jgi:hypothetical protein